MEKTNPRTCKEAATRFREWAKNAVSRESSYDYHARAEMLEAFGDTPVPQSILDKWDFTLL